MYPDRLWSECNGAKGDEPLEDAVASAVALDVQKAREGDQAAMARLIRQHSPQAYRVAYAILGNQHDAEDVVQEAFIQSGQVSSPSTSPQVSAAWSPRAVAGEWRTRGRRTGGRSPARRNVNRGSRGYRAAVSAPTGDRPAPDVARSLMATMRSRLVSTIHCPSRYRCGLTCASIAL